MNYKIVIFPLFLVTCLINQASPNCQQQPTVKHGHSSSSNVFSFNNLFNQQESSNNQQTWNQNLFFNPFELPFKAPGQTSQSHLGDNSNGLLVNPKVNNLASTSASSSSSGAPPSSSKANGGQIHATNRQLFAPGLFDFFQEQPPKVNVNSHGQTFNKGTSVAPKQPSQGMKQLLTPLGTLKSSSESSSSSSTESTSFSEFPLLFSGLVSATDAQDDADDLLGLIQQHQSQWGQNLPTQLTGPKQGTKVPKVNSGASSLSSSSSFNSASSFPGSSLGHSPQQKLPKDDTIKARQQLQNSGKILQDSISSSVASSPFNFDQLLSGEGPKNGQGIEKHSLTSIFSGDSSSSDSASATSSVKSINQINQLQSTADLIKSLQQKQSNQQQNIEKIESQSPYEQLLSSSGLTPQLLQSLSSSISSSSSSASSVPKVNNLGHISKSHEKHPASLNSFFQQESDNQNRHSIVDRDNKGALNIPAQVEQKTNEQTKPVKSSVTIPLLTFPSTSKHSSGRPERSGSANIHSQNSKSEQTGTSARINNHGLVKKPVTNTEHDTLFSSFSSSFTPIFNSAFQIQSNEQQNLADLATSIQRQQNQKLTDQQKSNKDQSQKSSQTSIPSLSSSSSTDSSSLSTEQIQKLNTFDLLKLIQQENNEEKTNSNGDLAPKIGQNSDKSKHQPPINTNKPTSSSPSSLSASTSTSTSPSTSKLSTSQTVLPLSSINTKLQSDSLINSVALPLAALSSSNLGSPITTANSPLINGKTNVPLSESESESSSDSSSTSDSSLIPALNKLSQTPILPSSTSLSSSTSSKGSVISNQQIINQNLAVKNEKSTDHRQTQMDQNKQYNKQKTPSIIDSPSSLQLHSKSDLKTPIQYSPIEQVTEKIKNQQKSSSTLPTTTSSLTALTDLSSLSTDQIQQLTKADFFGLLQNQNNKEKPTSHESLVPNIRQNSGKPTGSSDAESSSVSSSNSAFLTLPSTTKLSKQMPSSSAESSGTHLPLSVTASEAAIAAALSSLSDLNDDDDDDDDDDDETEDEEPTEETSEIVKQSVRPVQTPIQSSSSMDLSSLSTARIQKINTEDLLKLTQPQNRKDKTTSEESSAPIIGQNRDKSKNRPTGNTKPSPSSSSSAHSTFPLTLNSESNNNKHKSSAAQINSEAGSMLTASSLLSDEQIKSLTASPRTNAKSSSLASPAILDSLTTPPNTKLPKQFPTGTDVSSGENLPLVATDAAISAGTAIATASALSSSDSYSSSALFPHLQSSSLGDLSLQNDNQDSTDLKSGGIVTPLSKPPQTLSTDLSSLTAEQIQQLTPEDLIKLLKQPNNQLDKTISGVITQNADQINGKDTKPLTISSGTSPSSSSLHVQSSGPIQSELADSLSTSALASASALSWLSAEQINQLTEAELIELIQQQQNNQRDDITQGSINNFSNGEKINEKGKNHGAESIEANSGLLFTPSSASTLEHSGPSSVTSSPVSTGQIQPTSSVNVNSVLQNRNNGLTNQQAAIVGSLSKQSQTPIFPSSSSLSSSTPAQDSIISNQKIINQNLSLPVKNDKLNQRGTQTEQNKQSNKQKTPSPMGSQSGLQSPPSATEQDTEKSKSQQKLNTSVSPKAQSSSLTSSTPLLSTATSPIQIPINGISVESSNDAISSPSPTSSLTSLTDLSTLPTEQIQQLTKADLITLLQNQNNKEKPTSQESLVSNVGQNSDSATAIATAAALSSLSDSDEKDDEESTEETSDIIRQSVRPVQTPITSSSSPTDSLSTEQIQKLNTADLLQPIQQQNSKTKITSQKTLAPIIGQSSDNSANQPTVSPYVKSSTSPSASLASPNLLTLPTSSESFTSNIEQNSDKSKNKPIVSSDTDSSSTSSSDSAVLTLPSKLSKQIPSSSEIDLPLTATGTVIGAGTAIATAAALSSSASSLLSAAQVPSSNLHSQQQNNDSTKQKTNLSGPSNKSSQTSIAHPSTISPSPIPSQDIMISNAQIITPNLNKPTLSDQTSSTSTQSNLLSQLSPSHSLGTNSEKSSDHQQVETNSEKPIPAKHNSQKSQQKTPSRVDTPHSKSTPHSLVSLPFSLSTNSGQRHSSNRQPSIGSTRLKHHQHGENQNIHPTESQTNKGATNRPTSIIQSSQVPIDASKTLASTSTSPSSKSISASSSLDSTPAIHQQSNQQTQPSESSTSLLQSNQPESQIDEQSGDETLTRKSTLNGVSNGLFTGQGLNTDSLTSSSASNSALQSQLDMNKQSQIIQNEKNNKWTASSQAKPPSRGRTDKNFNLNNPIIDAGSSSSSSLLLNKQIEVPETTDLTKSGQQQTTRLSENKSLSPSQMKSDEQHDLDALTALAQEQRNNEKSTNSGQTMKFTDQDLTKQGLSTPRINSDSLSSSSAPKLSSGNAAKTLLSPNNDELSPIIHEMGSDQDSSSTSSLLSAEQIQQLTPNDLLKLIQQKNKETTDQEVINRDKFEKSSQTSAPSSVSSLLSAERIQQLTPAELLQMIKQNDKEKTNSAENFSTKVAQSSNKDNSKSTVSTDARSSSSPPTVNAAVLTLPSTSMLSKQIPSSTTVNSEIDLPLATATANAAATALLSASALSSLDSDSSSVNLPLLKSSSEDDLKLENADSTKQQPDIARPLTIPTLITSSPSSSTSSSSLSTDLSSNEQIQKLDTAGSLKLIQEKTNERLAPTVGQKGTKSKNHPTINTSTPTQPSPFSLSPSTLKLLTPQSVIPLPSMNEQLQSDSLISSAALPAAAFSSSNLGSSSEFSSTKNSPLIKEKTDVPLSVTESESASDTSSTSDSSLIPALNKLSQTPILPSSTSLTSSTSSQDSTMSNHNLDLPVKNEKPNQRQTQTEQNKQSNKQKTPSLTDTPTEASLQPHFESNSKKPIQSLPIEQVNEKIKNHPKASSALPTTTSSLTSFTDLSSLSTDQIQKLSKTDLIALLQNQNYKEKPTSQESLVSNIEQNSNKPKLSSDAESSSSSSASSSNLALLTSPATSKLSKQIPNSSDVSSKSVLPLSATAAEAALAKAASLSSSSDSDSDDETDDEEPTEEPSDIIRQSVRPVQTPITSSSSPTDLSSSSIEQTQKSNSENALKLTQPQNHKDETTLKESLAPIIGNNHDKSPNQPTVSPNIKYPSSASASLSPSNLLNLPSTEPASSSKTINVNKIPSSAHVSSGIDLQSVSGLGFTPGTVSESSSLPSTDSSSLSGGQITKHSTQDQNKLLKQQNNQLEKTSKGRETQNVDQINEKDMKPLAISSGTSPSSSPHSVLPSSSTLPPTSSLLVQPSGSIPSASPDSSSSSSSSAFDSASALSALSFLSAEQIKQLTAAELIQLIQQQNNQRDSNSQGSESSLSTNLSSLSAEQIQQLTPEGLIKLLKQQDDQSIKTSDGSEIDKADQINDKGTKPISISSGVSSSFSSPTTSSTSALLTSPSTSKIPSDFKIKIINSKSFNNKQLTNSDHMSSKTGSSSSTASALLAGQIPQASSVDSLSDLKQQHNGVIMQQSGPRLSEQPSQTQIAVPSASLDSKSLSNEQMQQLSQADLIKLLKEQNNKFDKTSKLSETNNDDQSKDTKSTAIRTDASSTSTLLVSPSASSDSSSSAIVDLGSQHQNKGMDGHQKSTVRPTSASSSLSAQQQNTATDQVKQTQNKNIESNNRQASNIDKMKASSQESSPSVTDLSSLTTEQIQQLTAAELLKLLKQQNNQWTINGQGDKSLNSEQISNTGNKQSTTAMSTPVRPSPSSSASSTSSSSSSSSPVTLLASPKQNQQSNKLKQQNVGLTNQQSLNHVLLNKPSQVPISSVLPSSSSVAHKDQHVDNQSTKGSMINTNQSPKDSLLSSASAISSELASSTTSFDAGQINPSNQASTQDLSQENSASGHSFNQQGKQSSLRTHTHPEVKHTTKPGETSSSSSSSSTSTSALTPLLTSSINPTSSVQVNSQHNQKDRGTSGKETSDFDTGKLADVSSPSSSSVSLTPSKTLNEKSSSNQKLTLDDLMKLVQQQQQNNQWNTNSQGERASIGQLLSSIGSINESTQSSSSSSIPLFNVDQKQMEHTNQFNENKKSESQPIQMNKQVSTNPIISKDTSASTSASSSSSSGSSSSIASADKIQLSKQQQLDLIKLIQQTQWNSEESAALASQFGINLGATPISSSSSTQSSESVPSSISLSTTNTEQVYFSKQQIVAYLIALIQAQLAKSPQRASPVSSSSSSFSSTYDSTQNYQTDEQQIVVLLIEILQQQQQNDHPTSSLLSLLSKNLFIISELPPQLLSLITSLFTTSLSSNPKHLSTINNQMTSADLKRLLQQIKQQSDVEKQLKSQIGSQGEQQLDSSQLISALSRLSSMPQTNAPSVGIIPANVQSNKQWNLNSQQQAALKALQSSQQYKPLDDPSAAAASSSMDSQLFEYPILMDPTNTKGLIPTMEDIAEQGILTLENFASDLLGR